MSRPIVLLVEDSPAAATLARYTLTASGLLVELCTTLAAALERLADPQRPRPSAVLLDLSLPDANGAETFDRIAAANPPPIVVLSGHDDPQQARALIARGAHDYLVKGEGSGAAIAGSVRRAIERDGASGAPALEEPPPVQIPIELADLAQSYLAKRCADAAALRAFVAAGEFGEARRRGHDMKGTGRGYGFPHVSALGLRIERAAEARDAAEVVRCADALEAYAGKVLASLGERG